MHCPKCGKTISVVDNFCPNCGHQKRKIEPKPSPDQPSPEEEKQKPITFQATTKENKGISRFWRPEKHEFHVGMNSPFIIAAFVGFFATLSLASFTQDSDWWSYYLIFLAVLVIFYYLLNRKRVNAYIGKILLRIKKGE